MRQIPEMKPGDVFGFSSCSSMGFWINLGTWGIPFWCLSHVAVVAAHPSTGQPLLFESTLSGNRRCVIQKEHVKGMQAHYPGLRIQLYHGKVWHYSLRNTLSDKQSNRLTEYFVGLLGVGYYKIGAFRSRATPWGLLEQYWRPENLQALFCAEVSAAGLRVVNEFRTGNASKWNPNSFVRALRRRGIVGKPQRVK